MGRKILFITTDQMRYDALGCNGGQVARTPAIDKLAAEGIRYTRAHNNNVVCMPARASMLTGQYVRTHGVWMNGVPLPVDAPSVAAHLHGTANYRTALIGKAHFEPFLDPEGKFYENRMARIGEHGPHRGFEHMELATHSPVILHYAQYMRDNHAEEIAGFYPNLDAKFQVNAAGGGETGAIQVKHNPVERGHYHTDWVAERTIAFLDTLDEDADWFVWMSFPDPHHPWDPPQSELHRHPWRDTPLPDAYPGSAEAAEKILEGKPPHWMKYFRGEEVTNFEAPPAFVPAAMTADQVREINAMTHIENELIDEACARVFSAIEARGWWGDTDVVFSTDHGEFQGDFGLMFKGPYHVDSLMRLPLIWRPAPSAGIAPAVVEAPVEQVDFAPTFCAIAGAATPDWIQGRALPQSPHHAKDQQRERAITEWDSELNGLSLHLRTICRDDMVCTIYEPSSVYPDGTGELYDLKEDPNQWTNLWDDPARKSLRDDLIADLYDHLPEERQEKLAFFASV